MFNVGLHATLVQFEKILKANAIEYKKAKKTPATTHGVLTFEVYDHTCCRMCSPQAVWHWQQLLR